MHPLRFLLLDTRRGRGVQEFLPQAKTLKSPGSASRLRTFRGKVYACFCFFWIYLE